MDDLNIPDFLKLTPDERKTAWANVPVERQAETASAMFAELRRKRELQKLRSEERRLSKLIDTVGGYNPATRKRLFDTIKEVEKQITQLTQEDKR